jgi:membrane protein DedA with SNARE-associated domain
MAGQKSIFTKLAAGTNIMKDKFYRFFLVEHPTGMIVGIILITLAHGMAKKAVPDETKYRKAFYYLLIALIVILAVVPWPFREVVGRPLVP